MFLISPNAVPFMCPYYCGGISVPSSESRYERKDAIVAMVDETAVGNLRVHIDFRMMPLRLLRT